MNRTLMHILRFVLLVLAQVLVINHIRLGGYVHPYIYLIFVMLLPINMPGWQLLFSGFGIGLVIDLFMGTPGMHMIKQYWKAWEPLFRRPKQL